MRNAKLNDVVTCERAGSGKYRVINVFNPDGAYPTVQIQSLERPMDIQKFFELHCTLDPKATREAFHRRAEVILAKPRRK